jgi:hypothetical protein
MKITATIDSSNMNSVSLNYVYLQGYIKCLIRNQESNIRFNETAWNKEKTALLYASSNFTLHGNLKH